LSDLTESSQFHHAVPANIYQFDLTEQSVRADSHYMSSIPVIQDWRHAEHAIYKKKLVFSETENKMDLSADEAILLVTEYKGRY